MVMRLASAIGGTLGRITLLAVVQPLLEVSPAVVDALTDEVTAFTATTLQGNITTWVWVVNDNPFCGAGSLYFTPPAPGIYELRVRGLTEEGLPSGGFFLFWVGGTQRTCRSIGVAFC